MMDRDKIIKMLGDNVDAVRTGSQAQSIDICLVLSSLKLLGEVLLDIRDTLIRNETRERMR